MRIIMRIALGLKINENRRNAYITVDGVEIELRFRGGAEDVVKKKQKNIFFSQTIVFSVLFFVLFYCIGQLELE